MSESRTYTILGVVGTGGFGKVYRARLQSSGGFSKDVAVKVLHDRNPDPDLLSRFRDEARILGLLRDRAIVSVDPPTRLSGRWAVVMDFVDGQSASALLKHLGPFPPGVACEIIGELARALDKAYRFRGPDGEPLELLHRDIKPANIQITPTGEVRLLDFGVARATFSGREALTTRSIAGTPGFIAPERLAGIEGPQGDVYSLGVVLWMMLTGEKPADSRSANLDDRALALTEDDRTRREALLLAARMRRSEDDERPTTRQVERACRALRQQLPEPWLRDWAEQIPERQLARDELAGQALSETLFKTRTDGEPMQDTPSGSFSTSLLLGTAGVFSVGVGSAVVLGVLFSLVVWLGLFAGPRQNASPRVDPSLPVAATGPGPEPEAVATSGEGSANEGSAGDAEEQVDDAADPSEFPVADDAGNEAVASEVEPQPVAQPTPTPRIAPQPARVAAPAPAPEPAPEPTPPPAADLVSVTFNSSPWGAAVSIDGEFVENAPLVDHPLSVGRHTVKLSLGDATIEKTIRVGASRRYPNRYDWVVDDGESGWRPRYP